VFVAVVVRWVRVGLGEKEMCGEKKMLKKYFSGDLKCRDSFNNTVMGVL
jgi:hypothetical protein